MPLRTQYHLYGGVLLPSGGLSPAVGGLHLRLHHDVLWRFILQRPWVKTLLLFAWVLLEWVWYLGMSVVWGLCSCYWRQWGGSIVYRSVCAWISANWSLANHHFYFLHITTRKISFKCQRSYNLCTSLTLYSSFSILFLMFSIVTPWIVKLRVCRGTGLSTPWGIANACCEEK